jgi:hypothetical protein
VRYAVLICSLQVSDLIALLLELRHRKLGTGEPVYVQSLSNKLEFSFQSTLDYLQQLGIKPANHGRWLAVTVPSDSLLDSKLAQFGHDVSVGKPMSARVNGFYHSIKYVHSFEQCFDGRFRFDVEWSSRPRSAVYCDDLNASARAHVR